MTSPELGRVYGLSYVPSTEISVPELCIWVSRNAWPHIEQRLSASRYDYEILEQYLGGTANYTWGAEPQLVFDTRRTPFGFNSCGFFTEEGRDLRVRIPVLPNSQSQICLTLFEFLNAANALLPVDFVMLDPDQFYWINSMCRHDLHGHSVGGYIFPTFFGWLRAKGKGPNDLTFVVEAMRDVYSHLRKFTSDRERRETFKLIRYDFRAGLSTDGRFHMACPGNACDLSIYPEHLRHNEVWSEFGCHNLDTAAQQLTLLSGLAALSDMARTELSG